MSSTYAYPRKLPKNGNMGLSEHVLSFGEMLFLSKIVDRCMDLPMPTVPNPVRTYPCVSFNIPASLADS